MMELKIGDVLPMKNLRVVIQDGAGWMDFKSKKGKCFVVMLLGSEELSATGSKLDPLKVMDRLGWQRKNG